MIQAQATLQQSARLAGRRAVIVTKHGKERALVPVLTEQLQMIPEILAVDTDVFGTFSGEIERQGSQLDALRSKIREGIDLTPYDGIIVANEGSFFPDPAFPFVTLNCEIVAFYDPRDQREIIGCAYSHTTNMMSTAVRTPGDVAGALARIGIPSHGAIVRRKGFIAKGLRNRETIVEHVQSAWNAGEVPIIEADMRACFNPTRMSVIAQAANNAGQRARSICPQCEEPGYWANRVLPGLPCAECGSATTAARAHLWACRRCGYERAKLVNASAEPAQCGECNP